MGCTTSQLTTWSGVHLEELSSNSQGTPSILWNLQYYYCVYNIPPLLPSIHQMYPVDTLPFYLCNIFLLIPPHLIQCSMFILTFLQNSSTYFFSLSNLSHATLIISSILSPQLYLVKVKFTLEQATKVQRGSRDIALLLL